MCEKSMKSLKYWVTVSVAGSRAGAEVTLHCSVKKKSLTVSKRTLDLAIKEINYLLHRSCLESTETAFEAPFYK